MGRHERRAELSEFRRKAAHGLLTYLIEASDPLDRAPVLRDAVSFWRANAPTRKPICIGCKAQFTGEARVDVAAFLLATSPASSCTASVSGICAELVVGSPSQSSGSSIEHAIDHVGLLWR